MSNLGDSIDDKIQQAKDRLQVLQATTPVTDPGHSSNWVQQEEVIKILNAVTESLAQAATTRTDEYSDVAQRLSGIERDVENIRSQISNLCKLVRDGNGQPSLLQRLANLEVVVANNKSDISEVKGHANTIIAARALSKSQVIAGLAGIIVTALLSTLALAATLMK